MVDEQKTSLFFYGGRQVKSVVRFLKSVLMLIVKGQQTMILAGIMVCTVRSIKTDERRRPFGPKMYFLRSITHQDRTYVRHFGTVMKLPLTSNLFRFYPQLNNCIVGDWY